MRHLFRKEPLAPQGLWVRCENEKCRELLYVGEFENNLNVCHKCQHHARLSARQRIKQLTDDGTFVERDAELTSADPLHFVAGDERYVERLRAAADKSGEPEAAVAGSAC